MVTSNLGKDRTEFATARSCLVYHVPALGRGRTAVCEHAQMASTISKDRTVEALREVWTSIDDLLSGLSDDEWHTPTVLDGWDVQDNVAHIIGTEEMLNGVPAPAIEIDRGARDHIRNDIGEFNEKWVESIRADGSVVGAHPIR